MEMISQKKDVFEISGSHTGSPTKIIKNAMLDLLVIAHLADIIYQ